VLQKTISTQDVTYSVSRLLFYLIRDCPSVKFREDIKETIKSREREIYNTHPFCKRRIENVFQIMDFFEISVEF